MFSTIALAVNVLLLIALLSLLQATLTLPGIAAIALTLGMAIDANVLINERIREELRSGVTPQVAISDGYERAWATILDSNVTTLIAGLALLVFGSGRGARLRGGALPRHPDLDLLVGGLLARNRQPLVRPAARRSRSSRSARSGSPTSARPCHRRANPGHAEAQHMEFFRIRRDIPFMRHALVLQRDLG